MMRTLLAALLALLAAAGAGHGHQASLHRVEFLRRYDTVRMSALVGDAVARARGQYSGQRGTVRMTFTALDREFTLQLRTQKDLFTDKARIRLLTEVGEAHRAIDKSMFHVGTVVGERRSFVHGVIKGGLFHGVAHIGNRHYYIEPARLFNNATLGDHDTIVYEESDVVYPHPVKRTCSAAASPRLQRIQESLRSRSEPPLEHQHLRRRKKRAFDEDRKTCRVALVADYTFFHDAMGDDEADAIAEMTFHINEATAIFSGTDFLIPSSGQPVSGVNFQIDSVVVYTETPNRFTNDYTTDGMLTAFSVLDHDDVCLAHLFLNRDFNNGVLGLAWVASPGGTIGGICQKRTRTAEGDLNLNTGFTTVFNFGARVPRSVSSITTTHEFGHNFGSPHDPAGPCAPGGTQGNFVMYASATDGSKANNKLFSTCSRGSIAAVLDAKAGCFDVRRESSVCGNGVREGTEECDCGHEDAEPCRQSDPCCRPGNCTLLPGMPCSARWDVCCDVTNDTGAPACRVADTSKSCSFADECRFQQFCNGVDKTCQPSATPEGALCNSERYTCRNGSCSGSLCAVYGAAACECAAAGRECDVCCVVNATCRSLLELNATVPSFNLTTGVRMPANSPCRQSTGFCFVESADAVRCISVDDQNPLDDLKNVFKSITVDSIVEWLKKHWPETLGGFGGAIVLFILLRVTYRPKKLKEDSAGDGRGFEESVPLLSRRS